RTTTASGPQPSASSRAASVSSSRAAVVRTSSRSEFSTTYWPGWNERRISSSRARLPARASCSEHSSTWRWNWGRSGCVAYGASAEAIRYMRTSRCCRRSKIASSFSRELERCGRDCHRRVSCEGRPPSPSTLTAKPRRCTAAPLSGRHSARRRDPRPSAAAIAVRPLREAPVAYPARDQGEQQVPRVLRPATDRARAQRIPRQPVFAADSCRQQPDHDRIGELEQWTGEEGHGGSQDDLLGELAGGERLAQIGLELREGARHLLGPQPEHHTHDPVVLPVGLALLRIELGDVAL